MTHDTLPRPRTWRDVLALATIVTIFGTVAVIVIVGTVFGIRQEIDQPEPTRWTDNYGRVCTGSYGMRGQLYGVDCDFPPADFPTDKLPPRYDTEDLR